MLTTLAGSLVACWRSVSFTPQRCKGQPGKIAVTIFTTW
jgi:hypothetical protein